MYQKITVHGKKGVFIPLEEFEKGKFFSGDELEEFRLTLLAQRELIKDLEKQVKK